MYIYKYVYIYICLYISGSYGPDAAWYLWFDLFKSLAATFCTTVCVRFAQTGKKWVAVTKLYLNKWHAHFLPPTIPQCSASHFVAATTNFLRLCKVKCVFHCRMNSPCDVRPRRAEDLAVQLDAAALGDSVQNSIRGQDLRRELWETHRTETHSHIHPYHHLLPYSSDNTGADSWRQVAEGKDDEDIYSPRNKLSSLEIFGEMSWKIAFVFSWEQLVWQQRTNTHRHTKTHQTETSLMKLPTLRRNQTCHLFRCE